MRSLLVLALVALPAFAHEPWEIDDCGLQPPGTVPEVPVPTRAWEPRLGPDAAPLVQHVRDVPRLGGLPAPGLKGQGALAGKVVYLSPGHGFTWNGGTLNTWLTQRGTTNSIVEDLVSVETLSQYLMPMLLNAGASVVPVRELDLNRNLVIVDNLEAGYVEAGAGFSTSSLSGWGRPTFPMGGAVQPFSLGSNRLLDVAPTATASATWTATLPESGTYDVAVSYTAFTARAQDAHYVVRHAGGETHFRVNQQRHGGTWVTLGRFFFAKGGLAQVVLQNDSAGTGNVSVDAVKFGGGSGLIDRGGGASGRPRFEESSRYQAQFSGAPTSVWAPSSNSPDADRTNDISTRSRMTAWVHEPGEDAVYFSWHTNAANASATGTETYVYGPNAPDGTLQFTGVAGSLELAQRVHAEFIADVKAPAGWNTPGWSDRRVRSAYFGEINPSNNNETPAILMEIGFHDAAADAARLVEPSFRYLAARAITQGMIKYWAAKDGVPVRLPPEAPTHVSAVNQGNAEVALRWRESPTDTQGVRGDAATGYRVYSSADGLGWDDGVAVTGTSARLSIPSAAPRFFRVTATNAGGESFPSATVGVRAPVAGRPLVLVVNGYDRLESAIAQRELFPAAFGLGTVTRVLLGRMNDGSYVRLYGDALAANDVGFDSADLDAVSAGDVGVSSYQLLAWFVGRGKQGGAAPSTAEQAVIKGFRTQNLPVFFTGNAAADLAFLGDVFQAGAPGPTGGLSVDGADALMGLSGLALDDGTNGTYDTGAAPAVTPSGAAVTLASYAGGQGAAVGTPGQSVLFGFPFETLVDRGQRVEVMRRVLAFLAPQGFDGGLEPVDAGVLLDAGVAPVEDAGVVDPDAGVLPNPDGGVLRQPVLAFRGGGCGAAPGGGFLVLSLALLRGRRRAKNG